MEKKYTNRLITQTSAYLLQHAHNPVDWYAWGSEAIERARAEDKPILVSIGYSACHWCHVMERESFEDEETAAIMNQYFINIKIDREERPDLDHVYMDAVQTITGSGGWPLNVFLTPELKPFYGGTYFPPVPAYNRNSWKQILHAVSDAYKNKKHETNEQANELTNHLKSINQFTQATSADKVTWSDEALSGIKSVLLNNADKTWGGFSSAPKFPQTFSILFLIRYYYFFGDEDALKQALLSLDKMMMGGMYDHLGGGFARYSTDRRWQIPHFEKMLYDNALLIDVYTEAFQLTENKEYARIVDETIRFIQQEMTSKDGGFFSALDADSEGEEGKYYTWTKAEIDNLLGNESNVFCYAYDISESGNWEHTNILWRPENLEIVAEKFKIDISELQNKLEQACQILYEARKLRIKPNRDEKVILSWNSLMIKSLCKAYAAFGNDGYLKLAEKNIRFIEKNLQSENGNFNHSWNNVVNAQEAFLDDYAALIQAYIFLQQVTGNDSYLIKAKKINENVIAKYSDEESELFYFTPKNQQDIIIRKKEIFDGATPSGNAMMAENLLMLSIYFDNHEWKERVYKMIGNIHNLIEKYPFSFGYWSLNLQIITKGFKEIVITGNELVSMLKLVLKEYIPIKIIQSSKAENDDWPLLKNRKFSELTYIHLCEDYHCVNPFETIETFRREINRNIFHKKS